MPAPGGTWAVFHVGSSSLLPQREVLLGPVLSQSVLRYFVSYSKVKASSNSAQDSGLVAHTLDTCLRIIANGMAFPPQACRTVAPAKFRLFRPAKLARMVD